MTYNEYMTNAIYSNYVDEHVSSEDVKDLETLDYLYYDLKDADKNDPAIVYEMANVMDLILKYNYVGKYITKAFDPTFTDWDNLYKEIDEIFNIILEKNNIHE